MPRSEASDEFLKWSEIISFPDNEFFQHLSTRWPEHKKIIIDQIAEFFYKYIQRTQNLHESPFSFKKEFSKLSEDEKSVWCDFASDIPGKLKLLNLKIRPYKDYCRTCLIPYKDLESLARYDYDRYCHKIKLEKDPQGGTLSDRESPVSFENLPDKKKRFYIELNHLLPVGLKKTGYEVVRPEEISEINEKVVRKLAKAIHSRYLHEMKKQDSTPKKDYYMSWIHSQGDAKNQNILDFDDLPEDIKSSNLDNAYHIPTKLLAIGYKIRNTQKGFKPAVLQLSEEEIETMARVEHIRWCWDKILHGWFYGKEKDSRKKTHPAIIPYEDLSESEKEKDRELVRLIPALLQDINYEVYPVSPDKISKLSYAIKPHSSIHRILDETRQMNTQIRKQVTLSPEIDEMVQVRNSKIEEAIKEIESSYNYAQHIQEAFLPDNLYVRECFAESFVLFKPKDIVSGDFYFFSRRGNLIYFAAADCTGHGIPGALLSIIGYGILDQAVNELKLVNPPEILNHLYSKVHRFLRRDEDGAGLSDDMDIILCTLDTKTGILNYSGVGAPLYHITENELIEYKPQNSREECREHDKCPFTSEMIQLKTGDTIYLFSDGYTDQFGGKYHKKYQSSRFKNFLLSIQGCSMPEQSDRLYEEIEKWREEKNEDQTDDILIIGIRI